LKCYRNIIIITGYDLNSHHRLIIDRVHRAFALQKIVNAHIDIPIVEIVECYGSSVKLIINSDFSHLNQI